jgi:hypothetical protein
MTLAEWLEPEGIKVGIETLTLALAVIGFTHGQKVYRQQKTRETNELARRNDETERENRLRRFEKYQQMQRRYREDASIQAVFRHLYPEFYETDTTRTPGASTNDMLNFMGFYEELAIMVNSEIMQPELAYYTFGVDAVHFWNAEKRWHDDRSWKLFNSFVSEVRQFRERFPSGPDKVAELKY